MFLHLSLGIWIEVVIDVDANFSICLFGWVFSFLVSVSSLVIWIPWSMNASRVSACVESGMARMASGPAGTMSLEVQTLALLLVFRILV